MGSFDTSDLYRRQHAQDHSAPTSARDPKRGLLIPLAVVLVGSILAMWGPLPGLGLFLVLGGVLGMLMTAAMVLTDIFS